VTRVDLCISVPGDQPPEGYLDWHAWADVQYRSGLRQARCPRCRLWRYPQEMSWISWRDRLVCQAYARQRKEKA